MMLGKHTQLRVCVMIKEGECDSEDEMLSCIRIYHVHFSHP